MPHAAREDRPVIDMALARRLVDARFPDWAGLPLRRVEPGGSDHVIFRLGRELSVRLPRHPGAAGQAVKESRWLPRLAPHLPLAVPEPVAVGSPAFGYPWSWAVSRWVDGEPPTVAALGGSARCARDLARFLTALRDCPTRDAPGDCHVTTGLAERDQATRGAIARLAGVFDARAMTGLWEAALRAPAWHRPPVWFHGDFHTGNLLAAGGRLVAVIDFGELGIGDPSRDLTIAFTLMSADARAVFRARLGVDEATWTRGRGWALATGLNAYLHYADTEPRVAAQTTRQIGQALLG